MPLNELQRKTLIERCNTLNIETVLKHIMLEDVSLDDMPLLSDERRNYIQTKMQHFPNPKEQQQWKTIEAKKDSVEKVMLLAMLNEYIKAWEDKCPAQNHLEEAKALKKAIGDVEDKDWKMVNKQSIDSLLAHLEKYPNSSHSDEIDEAVWEAFDHEQPLELQKYLERFPKGRNAEEARRMLNGLVGWQNLKEEGNILEVYEFVRNNPQSPYLKQAIERFEELKDEEIDKMQKDTEHYAPQFLLQLIEKHIFDEDELIDKGVVTPKVLRSLRSNSGTPSIDSGIFSIPSQSRPGATDVYFFGTPNTGKTCVLMGLTSAQSLHINLASKAGGYASALKMFTASGYPFPATPIDFLANIEATLEAENENQSYHSINLIEMAGEDFAKKIAFNPQQVFSFKDMGAAATELLQNSNRKIFFIIIDPTVDTLRINMEVQNGFDGMSGEPIRNIVTLDINQTILIQKLIDIFSLPENREIMKHVDAIHFIMTKSDILSKSYTERKEKAVKIFQTQYADSVLNALVRLCHECNINRPSNFCPKLYTFSLGNFYVGKLFDFDPSDANMLVKAIRNSINESAAGNHGKNAAPAASLRQMAASSANPNATIGGQHATGNSGENKAWWKKIF